MTNLEAYKAALAPYTLPKQTIEFLLTNQELAGSAEYSTSNKTALYKAVISGLYQLLTLTKEKDPGTENNYDVTMLEKLIKRYEDEYLEDEDGDDDCFIDRTDDIWQ